MEYKYNQTIWKKNSNNLVLVKFIFYRPDKNLVIYDYKGDLCQTYLEKIKPAYDIEIYELYQKQINKKKKYSRNFKRSIPNIKKNINLLKEEMLRFNEPLKHLNYVVYQYRLMNVLTNSNNNNLRSPKSRITGLKRKKRYKYRDFLKSIDLLKSHRKRIKNYKEEIGKLKQERNEWLKNAISKEE